MIPKIIHYCWFGGKPLPKLAKKCIDSWQKFMPNYEIKRWDESNFDVNVCDYVKEAYQAKKWAFVSDYARFAILYEYGGVYFDTDVEVIRSFDDIIARGTFMGLQSDYTTIDINPGLGLAVAPGLGLAAAPGLGLYKEILDAYKKRRFLNPNGSLNETTVVTYTTDILKKHGLKDIPGIQHVRDVYIYPKEYFNPIDHTTGRLIITPNTYAIHHFMASWCSPGSRKRGKIYQLLARYFGTNTADTIKHIWTKISKKIK